MLCEDIGKEAVDCPTTALRKWSINEKSTSLNVWPELFIFPTPHKCAFNGWPCNHNTGYGPSAKMVRSFDHISWLFIPTRGINDQKIECLNQM